MSVSGLDLYYRFYSRKRGLGALCCFAGRWSRINKYSNEPQCCSIIGATPQTIIPLQVGAMARFLGLQPYRPSTRPWLTLLLVTAPLGLVCGSCPNPNQAESPLPMCKAGQGATSVPATCQIQLTRFSAHVVCSMHTHDFSPRCWQNALSSLQLS